MTNPPGAWRDSDPENRNALFVNARSEPEQPDAHRLLGVPLGVLTLSQELIEEGFTPRIIDQSVQADVRKRMEDMPRPAFVGISCDGGEQIIGGREIAEAAKEVWPGIAVIWGGWGPTLSPHLYEHPTSAGWVDILVRGKGNVAIRKIAQALLNRTSLEGITAVTWRDASGEIHRGEDNPKTVPSTLACLPYELIDWDRYMTRLGIINYISAAGCPHRCAFCSIPVALPTWEPTDNEVVMEHLRDLHGRGIRDIVFFDDNFFTSKKRVLDLAQRLIDSGLGLQWHSNGRVDHLSHVTLDEFKFMRQSGCTYFNVGIETGDQEIADNIQKNIVVENMFEVARRCEQADIGLSVNYIIGLPGETTEAQVRSFGLLEKLYHLQPKMFVYWHLYLPSPGTPLWKQHAREGDLVEPETLDEMLEFGRYVTEEAGYYSRAPQRIFKVEQDQSQAVAWYFYVAFVAPVGTGLTSPFRALLRRWCRWRYENRHFDGNWDWLAFYWPRRWKRRLLWLRRSLVRDHPMLQNVLFKKRVGYKCHFSLIFARDTTIEEAAPIGGSGRAVTIQSAPQTLCE